MIKLLLLVAVLAVIPVWAGLTDTSDVSDTNANNADNTDNADIIEPDSVDEFGDEFWALPDSGRLCEPGQHLTTDTPISSANAVDCAPCPVGTFNFEGSRVDVCFECPIGTFAPDTGQTECYECGEHDGSNGATDSAATEQCAHAGINLDNFAQATVGVMIEVGGIDLCSGVSDLLYGISNVALYDAHVTECTCHKYDDGTESTKIQLEITPPAKYAWTIWRVLKFVEVHVPVINEYVSLGPHYVGQLSKFLNHEGMAMFELNLDAEMLQDKIEGVHIIKFEPFFQGHCPYAATVGDIYCDSGETDTVDRYNSYLALEVSGLGCSSNAEQIWMRNWVEMSEDRDFECLRNGLCWWKYISCEEISDTSEAVTVSLVLVAATNKETPPTFIDTEFSGTADADTQFTVNVVNMVENTCSTSDQGATVDIDLNVKCDPCKEGEFINDVGKCQKCPFTTWGNDNVHCKSCDWEYETPFWGMTDEYQCIELAEDRLRDPSGELDFHITMVPTMNMCGVFKAKSSLDDTCRDTYTTDQLSYSGIEDIMSMSLQLTICKISTNFASVYHPMLCGDDWDKSWEEVKKNIGDLICYVAKPIKTLEDENTSNDCAEVSPISYYLLTMDTEFSSGIELGGIELGGIELESAWALIPQLTKFMNLKTMNFASISDASLAIIQKLGITDLNSFTGWTLANALRDIAMAIPRGFSMPTFEFVPTYEKGRFFCEDDTHTVRRVCNDALCDANLCHIRDEDEQVALHCKRDECKSCAAIFYTGEQDTTETAPFDQCASCDDFPLDIADGIFLYVEENKVEAAYRCREGFTAVDCIGRATATCDYNSEPHTFELPSCVEDDKVEDTCKFPTEIENGAKDGDENYEDCPYAMYRCNDGYMLENLGARVTHCDLSVSDNYDIKCMERCLFPHHIENGQFVNEYRRGDEYIANYKCLYDSEEQEGRCNGEWDAENDRMVAVTSLPVCSPDPDGTCRFPQYISNGKKVHYGVDDDGNEYAIYECYQPFVMNPNKQLMSYLQEELGYDVGTAYMIAYNVAHCSKDEGGNVYFPECVDHKEAGHCGLPTHIEHGKAVEFLLNKGEKDEYDEYDEYEEGDEHDQEGDKENDDKMPMAAKYECDAGYVMYNTNRGDIGWCRGDGSMELPECSDRDDYNDIEFQLQNGEKKKFEYDDGRVFAGVVLGRGIDADGEYTTEWQYGCNNGFNDYAAGAICRSIDFEGGEKIPFSKKLKVAKHDFGWTNVRCTYDDTLVTSHNCEAMRYEQAIKKIGFNAICDDSDIIAVKCFKTIFKIDVEMNFNNKKMGKLTCNPQVIKNDKRTNLENAGVTVKFLLDGEEIHTVENVKYRKKRGFVAKRVNLKDTEFHCASCDLYYNDILVDSAKKCKDST